MPRTSVRGSLLAIHKYLGVRRFAPHPYPTLGGAVSAIKHFVEKAKETIDDYGK